MSFDKKITASAPAKLILSGEHAVVYGAPALAVALDSQVTVSFSPSSSKENQLRLHLDSQQFGEPAYLIELESLSDLVKSLNARYEQFLAGDLAISDVLQKPANLVLYVLRCYLTHPIAGDIFINSDIPLGAGMGSSAACIAALIRLCEAINNTLPVSATELAQQVRFCERLQHGRGSLVDAAAVSFGGMVKVTDNHIEPITVNPDLMTNWYRWHTGTPASSTGECVAAVRDSHATRDIWQVFAETTELLKHSLVENKSDTIASSIKKNHQLLCDIGVVPMAVQQVISKIENNGGAAKVCGAGSIRGDAGGQVLCYFPNQTPQSIDTLASSLGISLKPVTVSHRGAYVS